jgi:hypothetical protein
MVIINSSANPLGGGIGWREEESERESTKGRF